MNIKVFYRVLKVYPSRIVEVRRFEDVRLALSLVLSMRDKYSYSNCPFEVYYQCYCGR